MNIGDINNFLGDLDVELIDQILKGSFEDCESILEIGCGQGRNLLYFMKEGFSVYGLDKDPSAVSLCNYIAEELGTTDNVKFFHQSADNIPLEDESVDAVLCIRMLHFANNLDEFLAAWKEQQRVLKSGGLLFATMASNIGLEISCEKMDEWKWKFPEGSIRFLLTTEVLEKLQVSEYYNWLEPLKSINFNGEHSHSILVLQKK